MPYIMQNKCSKPRPKRFASGFSMVEIMVVIVIIISLGSILLTVFTGVSGAAKEIAAKQTMQTIKMALAAYETDFRILPPSRLDPALTGTRMFGVDIADMAGNDYQGAELLAMALIGPSPETAPAGSPYDGKNGYGWKGSARKADKFYGPYLALDNDSLVIPRWDANGDGNTEGEYNNTTSGSWSDSSSSTKVGAYILTTPGSENNRPIFYYRANSPRGVTLLTDKLNTRNAIWLDSRGGVDPIPKFDVFHNKEGLLMDIDHNGQDSSLEQENPVEFWSAISDTAPSDMLLLDVHPQWLERRQQLERNLRSADYMLVSAGADDVFGVVDEKKPGTNFIDPQKDTDDVIITGP